MPAFIEFILYFISFGFFLLDGFNAPIVARYKLTPLGLAIWAFILVVNTGKRV